MEVSLVGNNISFSLDLHLPPVVTIGRDVGVGVARREVVKAVDRGRERGRDLVGLGEADGLALDRAGEPGDLGLR